MLRMPPIRLNLSSAVSLCTILGAGALRVTLKKMASKRGQRQNRGRNGAFLKRETVATYSMLRRKHRLQPSKIEGKKNMPVWLLCVLNLRVHGG